MNAHSQHLIDKGIPWGRFKEFISLEADRFTILKKLLDEAELEYTILELSGNRHFVLAPTPPEESYLRRTPNILVAHYDRAEGSPGANDNSASVFLLFEAAVRLKKSNIKNWVIIFTDKEEIKSGESVMDQGSYALASGLKTIQMDNVKIFCFDACGTGDTIVVSNTLEYLTRKEEGGEKIRESLIALRQFAMKTATDLGAVKVLLAPTPFSDDAGFFRAGVAAQTITMLPSAECVNLVAELRKNPAFAENLITGDMRQGSNARIIPQTWRYLNTPSDSYLRLTPQYFRNVVRFAEALCKG